MTYAKLFIKAVCSLINLKILHLHDNKYNSKVEARDLRLLLENLAHTLIEDLFLCFIMSNDKIKDQNSENNPNLVSLDYFLKHSKNIKKLALYFSSYPYSIYPAIVNLIIEYCKLGKIKYFNGYNIQMLLMNEIDVLQINVKKMVRKSISDDYDSSLTFIFYKVLKNALLISDNVSEVLNAKSKKSINIKKIASDVAISKKFSNKKFIDQSIKDKNNEFDDDSILFSFCTVILITKFAELKELNLKCVSMLEFVFIECIKKLKSLQKLKFQIHGYCSGRDLVVYDYNNFIPKGLLSIDCKLNDINLFYSLEDNKIMKKLKIDYNCNECSCRNNTNFYYGISKSGLLSLNVIVTKPFMST
ncbi:hypothetical protein SteCoe_38896 [Stentor coeruleus]|uniref:Uncharacterized protein n=1 Tax=Stentor coeruleus TaxID=5963 RepID=A0A1R2AKZ0_9CILI|nr:hypothetical protein SteCoe_38896 [Stentor coeruleus]